MTGKRRSAIALLVLMSLVGIGLGVWLLRAGLVLLGCVEIGIWLLMAQRFATWLIIPSAVPSDATPPVRSMSQRVLLGVVCLAGAAICAVGVYLWYLWPEDWQPGLVFILFGLVILAPVAVTEVRLRAKAQSGN